MDKKMVKIYSDGSILQSKNIAPWGFIVLNEKDELIYEEKGYLNSEINDTWQIAAELEAIKRGISYCKSMSYDCIVYTDLKGACHWAGNLIPNNYKLWKRNTVVTQKYHEFIKDNLETVKNIIWVKGHVKGEKWNNYVDEFIRM